MQLPGEENLTIKGCMMCVCLSVCYLLVTKCQSQNVTEGHRAKRGTRTDGREALRCSSVQKLLIAFKLSFLLSLVPPSSCPMQQHDIQYYCLFTSWPCFFSKCTNLLSSKRNEMCYSDIDLKKLFLILFQWSKKYFLQFSSRGPISQYHYANLFPADMCLL